MKRLLYTKPPIPHVILPTTLVEWRSLLSLLTSKETEAQWGKLASLLGSCWV